MGMSASIGFILKPNKTIGEDSIMKFNPKEEIMDFENFDRKDFFRKKYFTFQRRNEERIQNILNEKMNTKDISYFLYSLKYPSYSDIIQLFFHPIDNENVEYKVEITKDEYNLLLDSYKEKMEYCYFEELFDIPDFLCYYINKAKKVKEKGQVFVLITDEIIDDIINKIIEYKESDDFYDSELVKFLGDLTFCKKYAERKGYMPVIYLMY